MLRGRSLRTVTRKRWIFATSFAKAAGKMDETYVKSRDVGGISHIHGVGIFPIARWYSEARHRHYWSLRDHLSLPSTALQNLLALSWGTTDCRLTRWPPITMSNAQQTAEGPAATSNPWVGVATAATITAGSIFLRMPAAVRGISVAGKSETSKR